MDELLAYYFFEELKLLIRGEKKIFLINNEKKLDIKKKIYMKI